MQDFIKHFTRLHSGAWKCMSPIELKGPSGNMKLSAGSIFVRGIEFVGVDVAARLDEQHEKDTDAI